MEQYSTFWDIIEKQGIEVPPIQRDYAQGRKSEKIYKIRNKFIDSIYNALNSNEPLRLDFIYGKIYGIRNEEEHRRNKQAIDSLLQSVKDYASSIDLTFEQVQVQDIAPNKEDLIYLIPLDGQQRLTTLFLLHWYFSKRLNLKDNFNVLRRFRYKTRKSSLAFVNLICSNTDLKFKDELDQEIIQLENFSNTWLDDPTVVSMLVVLNTLHLKFKDKSEECISMYWNRLIQERVLFFDFLNLKDFNLSDELYVKMNARGKQLSEFENFKAWLFGEIEKRNLSEENVLEENKRSFDIEWSDIFWDNKQANLFEIDEAYFNFFKLLYLYDLLEETELKGTNFGEEQYSYRIQSIQKNKELDFESEFDSLFFQKIKTYFKVLEICADFNPQNTFLEDFYKFYFSKAGLAPSWNNLIKNYLLLSYLYSKSKCLKDYNENDWKSIEEYHRITSNLFRNTIIDNPSLYKNAVSEIDTITQFLSENNYDISKWIESLEYSSKSVFQKHQIEEEILKYRLISQSDQWRSLILDAENITYFEGQLNFWFYKCDISLVKENYTSNFLEESYSSDFKGVTNRMLMMFNESGINRKGDFSERIFERALLSKSDYLLREGGYKCFGRDTGRDVSWKRLFLRDRNTEDTNTGLKEIFELDFNDVKVAFNKYINENIDQYTIDRWRKAFIEEKELWNYLGNLKYIRKIDNHGWVIIKDHYKTYLGAHYELFSLKFFIQYLDGKIDRLSPFTATGYYPAPKSSLEDVPCAFLNFEAEEYNYALDVRYLQDRFSLRFFSRNMALDNLTKENLVNLGFKENINGFTCDVSNEEIVLEIITNFSKKLEVL